MDMGFAVSCPLARRWRLISGSCPSTRTFDPCFFQTPPRGGSRCIITRPSPPSGWPEDFHLQAAEHAQHTTKPLARRTLRVVRRADSEVPSTILLPKSFGLKIVLVLVNAHTALSSSRETLVRKYQKAIQNPYQPRPPQTPAAHFKRLYRKRRGGQPPVTPEVRLAASLPIEI